MDTRTHYSLLTSDRDGCGDLLVIMIVIIFLSNSIHFVPSVKVIAPRGTGTSLFYELRELHLTLQPLQVLHAERGAARSDETELSRDVKSKLPVTYEPVAELQSSVVVVGHSVAAVFHQ